MSLFSRAHDILAAKANEALDSVENPNEQLDYAYQQMLDYVTRVRQALIEIAAERKRLELQEPQLRQTIDQLGKQAEAARAQGREDLAGEALSRQAAVKQKADETAAQHQELTRQEQQLQETLAQLQQRVSQFRSQKEVMKADYAVAQADDYGGTGEDLLRAQDQITTMVARAGATSELGQSGVLEDAGRKTAEVQEELDEAARAADVDSQLAALKAQLAAAQETPELPAGEPKESDG
ncbi:MAG TPA: PspA/IM30 family protein [Trebonia sp.]|nr:PspA/IM30 family protein [Trebonia sp.]